MGDVSAGEVSVGEVRAGEVRGGDVIVGVLLAGGAGQRMGGQVKALLPLGDGTVFDVCHRRAGLQVEHLALSVHDARLWGGEEKVCQAFDFFGPVLSDPIGPVIDDKGGRPGPLAGFLAALRWAQQAGAHWVALFPTDTPFIPLDLVKRLHMATVSQGARCAHARSQGRDHPVACLLSSALHDPLADAVSQGQRRVWQWMHQQGCITVSWDSPLCTVEGEREFPQDRPRLDPFWNINTPEDLSLAQAAISKGHS